MPRLKSYDIPLQMHLLPIYRPDACVLEAFYMLREFGCGDLVLCEYNEEIVL